MACGNALRYYVLLHESIVNIIGRKKSLGVLVIVGKRADAPVFFTICATNYLALAICLSESLQKHYGDVPLTVFLLDEDPSLPQIPGLSLRSVRKELGDEVWIELSMRYDVLEISTAVKPAMFKALFAEYAEFVVYCDPDIYFYQRPREMEEILTNGASGVILPHMLTPLPRDGCLPDDAAILKSGVFNLGFLALRACDESSRLLVWWADWLRTHCHADPSMGTFTDQKWMDFTPCLWPGVMILRDPGYDVAYWNLHERQIEWIEGQWRVSCRPLIFFHFSGFNPCTPRRLSRHENRHSEVLNSSELGRILADYSGSLFRCRHEIFTKRPLPRPTFENGYAFDDVARTVFKIADERGMTFKSRLGVGSGSFYAWMIDRELGSVHPRYVHGLLRMRPDVRSAYPAYEGDDAEALRRWIATDGLTSMGLSAGILEDIGYSGVRTSSTESVCQNVNYVGYMRAEMGLGEAARGYVRALHKMGFAPALMDISHLTAHRTNDLSIVQDVMEAMPAAPYDVSIVHVNADMLPLTLQYLGPNFRKGRYTIGLWAWESDQFPAEWHDRFAMVDEIWVGSQFMAKAISLAASCPVIVMPHTVELPEVRADRREFGIRDSEYAFIFVFDFRSVIERKNPHGVVRAFKSAFAADEHAALIIKSIAGNDYPLDLEELRSLVGDDARIRILDETLDRMQHLSLIASCDAFVSLHRLEGFGLGMAEAMALGKPVIATAYGGNMDFMSPSNAILVPFEMAKVEQDYGPYVKGSRWANPDEHFAAQKMRELYDNRAFGRSLGESAKESIKTTLSAEIIGQRLASRLRTINEMANISSGESLESRTGLSNRERRRLHIARILAKDALLNPLYYFRKTGAGLAYLRRKGRRVFVARVIEELRRRGM